MVTLEEYWLLLPEQNNVIYKEVQRFVNNIEAETFTTPEIKKSTEDFLCRSLRKCPFETCNIFSFLPSSISNEIIFSAISQLLDDFNDENLNKFLVILMNSNFDDELISRLEVEVFPQLAKLLENKQVDDKFRLCLAFLTSDPLRNRFLSFEDRISREYIISKRRIFVSAIIEKKHFIEKLIHCDDITMISNDNLRESLLLVQLLNNINHVNERKKYLQLMNRMSVQSSTKCLKNDLFNELQRLLNLEELITPHIPNIRLHSLASKFSVIDILHENLDLSKIDAHAVQSILAENKKFNERSRFFIAATDDKLTEDELFGNFLIVKLLLSIIMNNQHTSILDESSQEQLKEVKTMLRNIDSLRKFINILELSFSLIFLRWDNFSSNELIDLDRTIESGSESNQTEIHSMRSEKTAFICSVAVLDNILKLFKAASTQKLYSHAFSSADDSTKKSFLELRDHINDANWRFSIFYATPVTVDPVPIENRLTSAYPMEDVRKYFSKHQSYIKKKSSSDEDSNSPSMTMYRRKPRKKNTFRKPGNKTIAISNSTEQEQKSDTLNQSMSSNERQCAVSKTMLGSPEQLAIVCMNNCDFEATKTIIKAKKLENSIPVNELRFMENYNRTKDKLREIFNKYNNCSITSDLNISTVERLKNVATIGFEASKIQTIITGFANENEFHPSEEVRNVINKFQRQYPFLKMFGGPALQATIAVDFIISLCNSYENCFNIFNMLTKLWINPNWLDDDTIGLGYLKFTKNICECLQLYQSITNDNFGAKDLLYNECDVLRPELLSVKLEKEKAMSIIQSIEPHELDSLEKWRGLLKLFEGIRGDVNYFQRIYSFLVNVTKLLKINGCDGSLSPLDVIKTDLTAVIGEIIFVKEKIPSEIVEIVDNLNINFVHVLCLNTIPAINCYETDDSDVIKNLIENLTNDNLHTNSRTEDKPVYTISQEVLNFIKKHNSLAAYLLQEYHSVKCPVVHYEQRYLQNLMALEDVKTVGVLHRNNLILSALSYDRFDVSKLEKYLEDTGDFRNAVRILHSCNERSFRKKGHQLKALQDILIVKSLHQCNNDCDLIEQINDINVKSKYLLENILSIESSEMVNRLIRSMLLDNRLNELSEPAKTALSDWLQYIKIYEDITIKMGSINWIETRKLSINSSELILKRLMDLREFELCLSWLNMHPLNACPSKYPDVCQILKQIILNETKINSTIFKITESLPLVTVLDFYENLLSESQNFELLEYIIAFLSGNSIRSSLYQQYRISLRIFSELSKEEQENNWVIFNTPLMIIEQYLMNSKHETISLILKSINPLLSNDKCKYCFARRSSAYDTKSSSDPDFSISLSQDDFGQNDHTYSVHCIDSLLKVYASKALDFRVSEPRTHLNHELLSQSMASLDSLCGSFVMPKTAPVRLNWVKDEAASHCMCCRRSVFTMFTRRHHCRRCGRVVCHVCSTKRIEIPELYSDVKVRSCDDCCKQIEIINQLKSSANSARTTLIPALQEKNDEDITVWQFSGNSQHDKLLREEFCFEYAPSISMCLSILKFHSSDEDCIDFLLYHCQKFELLLRPIEPGYPNPEIDYALVTRMMHCLALAAKVRGGPPECDTICDRGEIVQSVVYHGCESLLPMEPLSSSSFRKLRDSLVLAEKWSLALELSLKWGFATTGVMAAWGIACLRAGCFDTAREKFAHCVTKIDNYDEIYQITSLLLQDNMDDFTEWNNIPNIKRPPKSPPLLDEILSILKVTCHLYHPNVLARANVIRDSNTSLTSNPSRKRDQISLHEPALNILHTLSSLKQITQGIYEVTNNERNPQTSKKTSSDPIKGTKLIRCPRFYEESVYYLTRYGSHSSIITFLVENEQLATALKYFLCQNVDSESFINLIFLPFLTRGKVDVIINLMIDVDNTLLVWKETIIRTCRYLEHKGLLNSLYHIQILLKDPVRASMTCVKFYSMNCSTYRDLQNNSFHLMNAQKHMQAELELCQWEEISVVQQDMQSILMKMDSRTLNSHINTIWRQIEVTKFLSSCEENGRDTVSLLPRISAEFSKIPTLFGTMRDKIQLAVLTIISGSNINEGFGLAYRIIQDFNLSSIKVYGITAKYLSENNRLQNVEKLIENIKSNSDSDFTLCDEIISISIETTISNGQLSSTVKQLIESLIKQVTDIGVKISCHISSGQLKSAYLLAVQYNRFNDIKKVLRKAEQTNQLHIKKLCEKKLNAQF